MVKKVRGVVEMGVVKEVRGVVGRGVAKGLGVRLGKGVVMEVRGVAEKESRFRGKWFAENVGQGEGGKFQARECRVNMARSLSR